MEQLSSEDKLITLQTHLEDILSQIEAQEKQIATYKEDQKKKEFLETQLSELLSDIEQKAPFLERTKETEHKLQVLEQSLTQLLQDIEQKAPAIQSQVYMQEKVKFLEFHLNELLSEIESKASEFAEFTQTKSKLKTLENLLHELLSDLEEKAPLITELKENYQNLLQDYKALLESSQEPQELKLQLQQEVATNHSLQNKLFALSQQVKSIVCKNLNFSMSFTTVEETKVLKEKLLDLKGRLTKELQSQRHKNEYLKQLERVVDNQKKELELLRPQTEVKELKLESSFATSKLNFFEKHSKGLNQSLNYFKTQNKLKDQELVTLKKKLYLLEAENNQLKESNHNFQVQLQDSLVKNKSLESQISVLNSQKELKPLVKDSDNFLAEKKRFLEEITLLKVENDNLKFQVNSLKPPTQEALSAKRAQITELKESLKHQKSHNRSLLSQLETANQDLTAQKRSFDSLRKEVPNTTQLKKLLSVIHKLK